jgi:hypothetical protein
MDIPPLLQPLPENDATLIPSKALPSFVGLAEQTLARYRCSGQGPSYLKVGRTIFYRTGSVREWLAKAEFSHTR